MQGIWIHTEKMSPRVNEKFMLSLGEGNTPLETNTSLAKSLELENIYLKREDLNPTGSHKDRGLAFEISAHIQDGKDEFIISSSGNAAISAVNLLKDTDKILHIFIPSSLSINKLQRLTKALGGKVPDEIIKGKDGIVENIHIHFSKRPLSTAFSFSTTYGYTLLRGSTDKYGYEGFKTIAFELIDSGKDFDHIFIPASSGTTAKGIFEGYKGAFHIPSFNIVQTTKINTLVHRFDKDYQPSVDSIAEAIVDRVGHRVKEVEEIIKNTNGNGWIICDKEIINAQNILQENGIISSNESALTIAAIIKAKSKGLDIKNPVCIMTGVK